jgi:hypothetical protein
LVELRSAKMFIFNGRSFQGSSGHMYIGMIGMFGTYVVHSGKKIFKNIFRPSIFLQSAKYQRMLSHEITSLQRETS